MARTTYPRTGLASGYNTMLHTPTWKPDAGGPRGIIALHGHGGDAQQIAQGLSWAGHPEYYADAGFYVIGVDMGATSWLNSAAMSAITAAYNSLIAAGIRGTKVGLTGWSMGGGSALRWMLENPAKTAALWAHCPITDLDWVGTVGYSGWATELDAAYSGSYALNGSTRGPIENAASYRNVCPIKLAHCDDDPVIPYSHSTAFISAVNDPLVTLRNAGATGGHQGPLINVPPKEVCDFFSSRWNAA